MSDCETDRRTEYGQTAKCACQHHWPQGKLHNKLLDVLDVYLINVCSLTLHRGRATYCYKFTQIRNEITGRRVSLWWLVSSSRALNCILSRFPLAPGIVPSNACVQVKSPYHTKSSLCLSVPLRGSELYLLNLPLHMFEKLSSTMDISLFNSLN